METLNIVFLKPHQPFNSGERASVPRGLGNRLIHAGVARAFDKSYQPEPEEAVLPTRTLADDREFLVRVKSFIAVMDSDDSDLWTSAGKPKADVLSQRVGLTVSASVRDEAWAEYQDDIAEPEGDDDEDED